MSNRFGGIGSSSAPPSFLNQIPTPWAPCDVGDDSVRSHNVHRGCRSDYRCPHRLVFHQANINFEKSSWSSFRQAAGDKHWTGRCTEWADGKIPNKLIFSLVVCTLFRAVLTVIVENTHVNRVLKAGRLDEDASRIIIETYLHPLWCSTVPLTTSHAFPVIILRSQCHLKETPALFSPHGWDIKSEEIFE